MVAPTPDADGWIAWEPTEGAACPVKDGTLVRLRLRVGEFDVDTPEAWGWSHIGFVNDIIAYRILSPGRSALTSRDRPIPPYPGPLGRTYLAKLSDGTWAYINHAGEWCGCPGPTATDQAAEIAALKAENARLREALEPFAELSGMTCDYVEVRVASCRRARAALQPKDA